VGRSSGNFGHDVCAIACPDVAKLFLFSPYECKYLHFSNFL
jgi:hypothetical protein